MAAFPSQVTRCETALGYTFANKTLCVHGLYMGGSITFQGRTIAKNDRMALLGDLLLKLELCKRWFETGRSTGEWSTAIQNIESNNNLARIGFSAGLDECIITNPGTARVSPKMMATTVEALLAAVHQDGGDMALSQVIATLGLDHEYLHMSRPLRKGTLDER